MPRPPPSIAWARAHKPVCWERGAHHRQPCPLRVTTPRQAPGTTQCPTWIFMIPIGRQPSPQSPMREFAPALAPTEGKTGAGLCDAGGLGLATTSLHPPRHDVAAPTSLHPRRSIHVAASTSLHPRRSMPRRSVNRVNRDADSLEIRLRSRSLLPRPQLAPDLPPR